MDRVPFFRLPLEIRNKIYRNLLVTYHRKDEAPVRGKRKPPVLLIGWDWELKDLTRIHTSILATCKQVAFEATRILYSSNILRFESFDCMNEWLDTIDPESVKAVRDVEIISGYLEPREALETVLLRCTGLRRFHIRADMMYCAPPYEPLVCDYLNSVKWVLEEHPTFGLLASGHAGGFAHKRLQMGEYGMYRDTISITFLVDTVDGYPEDGFSFDIQEAIEQHAESSFDPKDYFPVEGERHGASAASAGVQAAWFRF